MRTLLVVVFVCVASLVHAQTPNVTYIYDELGRLVGVVAPSGEAAIYSYDAVGNLLSISRHLAGTVSIVEFSPNAGPSGTVITISGIGFSATPSENSVSFNGTAAAVLSASLTVLTVAVPAGATTGPITVVTPTGSASSASAFAVTANMSPVITNFSPAIAAQSDAVSITGINFEGAPANNKLTFNVTRGQTNTSTVTTLGGTVPLGATSGRIALATPGGATTSTNILWVPPPPYSAADVASTALLSPGVAATNGIASATRIGLFAFDGAVGQRISATVTDTIGTWNDVTLKDPAGATVTSTTITASSAFFDERTLSKTGTYSVIVDPRDSGTGNATVTLYDVPADVTGTITPGGAAVTQTFTTPGQNGSLTFNATASQRVSLLVSKTVNNWVDITLTDPSGATVASMTVNNPSEFMDVQTLATAGTYKIALNPWSSGTGNATLTLYDVPADVTGTITPGGAAVTQTFTTAGQNGSLTFNVAAGQRVSLLVSKTVNTWLDVTLNNPSGGTVASMTVNNPSEFMDVQTLATAGTYTIALNPWGSGTGNATVTLYAVPADVTGAITPGGVAVTQTFTTAGQNGLLTFSGTAGQRVSLGVTKTVNTWLDVALKNPSGGTVASMTMNLNSGFINVQTLATTGTYTISLDPRTTGTGNATVTLYDVPPDVTGTITPGGSAVTQTVTTPGQNGLLTFSGTAGQQVTVRLTNNGIASLTVKLLKPDGSTQTSSTSSASSFNLAIQTLATTGTYSVVLDPGGASTGSVTVQVTSP